ncbi:hypothetical protein HQ865_24715 [Mucilaginibacter mali]|uniref:Big-1 domain-containing protein n=1 Tax=Mucilaginibacter mali TaxID=2740462 RepID=A0A7D4UP80_9SPHI|nr:hypothetical protein [Mucilaginibacter mali]QKJ32821.1 hypothetical protein HQ865_24715 [Mucilaginibacter mali]
MKRYSLYLFTVFLLLASCKKTQLKTSGVIKFENATSLSGPADNINTVTLTATVPNDSDPQTQVVFTTDLGTFVNSNSNTITTGINDNYQCVVQLKSAAAGTATIRASVLTLYSATTTVTFTAPNADNIFTLAPFTDNVAADGTTTLVLTAVINKSLPATAQSIVFTADNSATFSNNTGTITIPADATGNAIAYLKKSAEGPVHVTMTDLGVTRSITVNFIAPNADNIFTIAPFIDNIMADGVSTMVLTAAVNKKLPVASQTVTFTADNGATFSNGNPSVTATADAAGNAITYLKKTVEGPVHVTMASGGATRSLTVNFTRAVPDNMLLTNNPAMTSGFGNNLSINISLLKTIGKPATGYLFSYNATDSSGNLLGIFSNGTASDANGAATVNFTTGNSPYKGIVKITIALQQYPAISQTTTVLVN